jgi:hypothetical protein
VNRLGALDDKQLISGHVFLSRKLLVNEFPRDSQRDAGRMS